VKVLRHFCVAIIFDVLFFGLQGPLKKYLSLELLLKLATFIDGTINFQNIFFKNLKNYMPPPYSPPPKNVFKNGEIFLNTLFSYSKFSSVTFEVFFLF
jgi:hypothetical protein